jgi:hypothetical protein
MQYVQEFYQTVRDKCFKVCVTSPGSSLSGSEQKCLGRCMDRYQDVSGLVPFVCVLFGSGADADVRSLGTRRALAHPLVRLSLSAQNKKQKQKQQATNVVTKAVLSQQGMN